MRTKRVMVLLSAFFWAGTLLAQGTTGEKPEDVNQPGPGRTVVSDTSKAELTPTIDEGRSQRSYVLKPWRAMRGHLHNKIIHLPVGFALSAFFLSLLALRWSEMQPAIRWLVLGAALGALVAYVTGTNQATAFQGGAKDWVIELHEQLGIATAVALWVWAVSLWVRPIKKWAFLIGLLATGLVLVTGFFGGIVAHG